MFWKVDWTIELVLKWIILNIYIYIYIISQKWDNWICRIHLYKDRSCELTYCFYLAMCSIMGDTLKLHFRTSTEALDDNIGSLQNNKLKTISNIVCGTHVFSRKQICLLILFSYLSVCFLSIVTTVSTVHILRCKCTGMFG